MRLFRFFLYLGYVIVAVGCFFLTTKVIIPFVGFLGLPVQDITTGREVMYGIAGAATLLGILHPAVMQRCFANRKKGQFTRLGRWAMHRFNIPEDRILSALACRWLIPIIIGIILFLVNLFLSF